MLRPLTISVAILALTACGQQHGDAVERIAFDSINASPSQPLPSPDTTGAEWQPLDGARSIRFGKPGEAPMLTIACELNGNQPADIHIVRNARADPGAKALFALLGSSHNSRLNINARLNGSDWRWESLLPATDPLLDVFTEGGAVEATIPGAGTLKLAASDQPGRLLTWCRRASSVSASLAR